METALKDFDIAMEHNHDNPEFPFYRGLVFEVMGNHDAARTWFNQVRIAAPVAAPRFTCGKILLQLVRYALAQAILRDTTYFPALLHAALVLHSTGMLKESVKRFDIALMIQPNRADVKEARGRVLQVSPDPPCASDRDMKGFNPPSAWPVFLL